MRIGIQTWGSDGDVRPFIALAGGLSANGHLVTLIITSPESKDYSAYGESLGFSIIHAHESYRGWDAEVLMPSLNEKLVLNKNPLKQVQSIFEDLLEPAVEEMYQAAKKLCADNDLVIGHSIIHPFQLAAEQAACPYAMVVLCPAALPSKFLATTGVPYMGTWLNAQVWKAVSKIFNLALLKYPNQLRRRKNYRIAKDMIVELWQSQQLTLIGASPALCESPSDWGKHLQMCGFFTVPEKSEEWLMPAKLKAFFADGPAPIYMTFGSLTPITLQENIAIFVAAVKLAGCRAVIQAQWDKVSCLPEHKDIYCIDKTPHHQVFPQCALVVHHGGAGTTQSSLLCGCPSIVVEHFADQLYWGEQLKKAGVVKKILHRRTLTANILATEIIQVLASPEMKQKAEALSQSMLNENGVKRAVALIEKIF